MPSKKHTAGPGRLSRHLCLLPPAYDLQEAKPATVQDLQPPPVPWMAQFNFQALTNMIATAVSDAMKSAMATLYEASVPNCNPTTISQVEHLATKEITKLTQPTGTKV